MQKQDREILKIFQTEDNRKIEEDFASMLSENPNLRLFFINENQAYTDGKNIVVDPANDELFCDYIALKNTEEFLGLPQSFSNDRFIALKIITRAQNIHEALHIIYTNFPPDLLKDPRGKNNKFNQMKRGKYMIIKGIRYLFYMVYARLKGFKYEHIKKKEGIEKATEYVRQCMYL